MEDYMMLDAYHMLRFKPAADGAGWQGDVVMLPGTSPKGKKKNEPMEATHLFDVPPQPDLDALKAYAGQALLAYREG